MTKPFFDFIDVFFKQKSHNQVIMLLLLTLAVTGYFLYNFDNRYNIYVKEQNYARKHVDSIYNNRLNSVVDAFQKKVDDCYSEKIKIIESQNKYWKETVDALYKETDRLYQKQRELESLIETQ